MTMPATLTLWLAEITAFAEDSTLLPIAFGVAIVAAAVYFIKSSIRSVKAAG